MLSIQEALGLIPELIKLSKVVPPVILALEQRRKVLKVILGTELEVQPRMQERSSETPPAI